MRLFSKHHSSFYFSQLFLIVFIVFPVFLALVSQIVSTVFSWNIIKILQIGFFVSVLIFPIFIILNRTTLLKLGNRDVSIIMVWILAIAVALRITLLPIIGTSFLSDMEDVHFLAVDISSGNPLENIDNYPNIPKATYLNMTALVLSFVYKIFGASTANAKLFMILLGGITTLLVFFAGRELANVQVGLIASLLFAILPSLVCYTGVLTGDHYALPLIVLVLIIQSRLGASDASLSFSRIVKFMMLGMTIGFIDWFRPVGNILLIALILSTLLNNAGKTALFRLALLLVILCLSYMTVNKISLILTENIFQTKVLSATQRLGAYFYVGLNPESNGGVNLEDAKFINEIYTQFGQDSFGANRYLFNSAFARLEPGQLSQLLKQKFLLMWSSHDALFDYALAGSNDQELVNMMRNIEAMLYIFLSIFILFQTFYSLRRGSQPTILTMQLFIFGFALLLLFFEVQNRYIISVIPYSILLSVLGMQDAFSPRLEGDKFTLQE